LKYWPEYIEKMSYNFENFFYQTLCDWILEKRKSKDEILIRLRRAAPRASACTKASGFPLYLFAAHLDNLPAAEALVEWGIDPDEIFEVKTFQSRPFSSQPSIAYNRRAVHTPDRPTLSCGEYLQMGKPKKVYLKLLLGLGRQSHLSQQLGIPAQQNQSSGLSLHESATSSGSSEHPSPTSEVRSSPPSDISKDLQDFLISTDPKASKHALRLLEGLPRPVALSLQESLSTFDRTQVLAVCRGKEYLRRIWILIACNPSIIGKSKQENTLEADIEYLGESVRYLHPEAYSIHAAILSHQLGCIPWKNKPSLRDISLFPNSEIRSDLTSLFEPHSNELRWKLPNVLLDDLLKAVQHVRRKLDSTGLSCALQDITQDWLTSPVLHLPAD
jgi:hypothetical protein